MITLPKAVTSNHKLLVAVSGGADSIYLSGVLAEQFPKEQIVFAHFDHQLQVESKKFVHLVETWAGELGVEFVVGRWEKPEDGETKARQARYLWLEQMRQECDADFIVTAHHANDQAETILFNFLRGTGSRGLAGIADIDCNRHLWRPLLTITKSQILEEIKQRAWQFIEDPSNQDLKYQRNYLRHQIIPELKQRFPNCTKRWSEQAELWRELDDYLQQQAITWLSENQTKAGIDRAAFLNLSLPLQGAIWRNLLTPKTADFKQIKALNKFIKIAESSKKQELLGFEVQVFDKVFFVKNNC